MAHGHGTRASKRAQAAQLVKEKVPTPKPVKKKDIPTKTIIISSDDDLPDVPPLAPAPQRKAPAAPPPRKKSRSISPLESDPGLMIMQPPNSKTPVASESPAPVPKPPIPTAASGSQPVTSRHSVSSTVEQDISSVPSSSANAVASTSKVPISRPSATSDDVRPSVKPAALPGPHVKKSSVPPSRPPPKKKITHNSDDELTSFFSKRPPPRSAAAPASPPSSSASSRSSSPELSDKKDSGMGAKPLNLPAWTRGRTGAERRAATKGFKANKKRKRLGESSSSEDKDEDEDENNREKKSGDKGGSEGEDDDDVPRRKERKPAPRVIELESDDSLEGLESDEGSKEKSKGLKHRRGSPSASPPPKFAKSAKSKGKSGYEKFKDEEARKKKQEGGIVLGSSDAEEGTSSSPQKNADDDDHLQDLDPSLREMLAGIAKKKRKSGESDEDEIEITGGSESMTGKRQSSEDIANHTAVTLTISRVFDPEKTVNPVAKAAYEKPISYTHPFGERFEDIFRSFAQSKNTPMASLVFTYRGVKVWHFATPKSLHILHSADIKAYNTDIYERIQKEKKNRVVTNNPGSLVSPERPPVRQQNRESSPSHNPVAGPSGLNGHEELMGEAGGDERGGAHGHVHVHDEDEVDPNLRRISIRGSQTMVLPIQAKVTTTVGQLIKRFCKEFDIDASCIPSMWMEFDGERLDSTATLGSIDDIEDEETIDVRGVPADKAR